MVREGEGKGENGRGGVNWREGRGKEGKEWKGEGREGGLGSSRFFDKFTPMSRLTPVE